MALKVAPVISQVDLVVVLSNMWEASDAAFFIDSSEEDFRACSITFYQKEERATIGIVYAAGGGTARVFNGRMKVVGQLIERLTVDDYHGLYNMMLKIQQSLPSPMGITAADIIKDMEPKK